MLIFATADFEMSDFAIGAAVEVTTHLSGALAGLRSVERVHAQRAVVVATGRETVGNSEISVLLVVVGGVAVVVIVAGIVVVSGCTTASAADICSVRCVLVLLLLLLCCIS